MHPFEEKTLQFCRRQRLFPPGSRVIAAVSGGVDSVTMLKVIAVHREALGIGELAAVYIDHNLRPGETGAECELVRDLAFRLSVPFSCRSVPVEEHCREKGVSLEASARELRYQALRAAVGDGGLIAVAHHGDDQAEELLIRLIRGTGTTGLAGMLPDNGLGVVRPFLCHDRTTIMAYAADLGLSFCHDSSNDDSARLRNRVRHQLLPELERDFNPAMREALRRTAAIIAGEDDYLRGQARAAREECVCQLANGETALLLAPFAPLHPAIKRRVIDGLLWSLGCPATTERIETLRELAASGRTGARIHLPDGLRVAKKRDLLLFSYPLGRRPHRER